MSKRARRGIPFRCHLAARRLARYRDQALYLAAWVVAEADDTLPACPDDLRAVLSASERPWIIAEAVEAWRVAGLVVDAPGGRLQLIEDPIAQTLSALDPAGRRGRRKVRSAERAQSADGAPTERQRSAAEAPTERQRSANGAPTERRRSASASHDAPTSAELGAAAEPPRVRADRLGSAVIGRDIPPNPPGGGGEGGTRERIVVPLGPRRIAPPDDPSPRPEVPPRLLPLAALWEQLAPRCQMHEPLGAVLDWATRVELPTAEWGLGVELDWAALAEAVLSTLRAEGSRSIRQLTTYLARFLEHGKHERFLPGAQARRSAPGRGHDPDRTYTQEAPGAERPNWADLPEDDSWPVAPAEGAQGGAP